MLKKRGFEHYGAELERPKGYNMKIKGGAKNGKIKGVKLWVNLVLEN